MAWLQLDWQGFTPRNAALSVLDLVPPRVAAAMSFFRAHRRLPHISKPLTFSEKVQWRKLYERDPRFPDLANKITAKRYVSRILGDSWLIPTLWSGTELPQFPPQEWPIPYVLKSNHGSGWHYFVRRIDDLEWTRMKQISEKWLATPWPRHKCEEFYNKFQRQIIVEPIVGDPLNSPVDYKFFVFDGIVKYIQVDFDRFTNHTRAFYDRNWVRQNFSSNYPLSKKSAELPQHLAEMIKAAEQLGVGFSFVRVDLYDLQSGPKFGEMTFTPGGGLERFDPPEMDLALGNLWKLGAP